MQPKRDFFHTSILRKLGSFLLLVMPASHIWGRRGFI